jgi:UDP-N-acetylglucosamine enolpyruvyl transferase
MLFTDIFDLFCNSYKGCINVKGGKNAALIVLKLAVLVGAITL